MGQPMGIGYLLISSFLCRATGDMHDIKFPITTTSIQVVTLVASTCTHFRAFFSLVRVQTRTSASVRMFCLFVFCTHEDVS